MSFLTIFPFAEIASVALGGLVASVSALDLFKSRRKSKRLAKQLHRSKAWKAFEQAKLKGILSDHLIDDAEWLEIFAVMEGISKNSTLKDTEELRLYSKSSSSKRKKLLLSDVLEDAQAIFRNAG